MESTRDEVPLLGGGSTGRERQPRPVAVGVPRLYQIMNPDHEPLDFRLTTVHFRVPSESSPTQLGSSRNHQAGAVGVEMVIRRFVCGECPSVPKSDGQELSRCDRSVTSLKY